MQDVENKKKSIQYRIIKCVILSYKLNVIYIFVLNKNYVSFRRLLSLLHIIFSYF